jgi:hypothetical protein
MLQVIENDLPNAVQFLGRETIIVRQSDRFEPELANGSVSAHMNMPRFVAIEAVKEKPIGA